MMISPAASKDFAALLGVPEYGLPGLVNVIELRVDIVRFSIGWKAH